MDRQIDREMAREIGKIIKKDRELERYITYKKIDK